MATDGEVIAMSHEVSHDPTPVSDRTRPLLLGYLHAHILMTEIELATMQELLALYARKEGYCLGRVFVERIDRAPAASHALRDAIGREEARAVVVPSLRHLAMLGPADVVKEELERDAGVRVLIAAPATVPEPP